MIGINAAFQGLGKMLKLDVSSVSKYFICNKV